ncbi:hypothetical protein QA646_29855 (plasmid) [Rhizobium sp. CB3090]|uniref:hypothetical protein n=1 Tax=Rhizobium sp. CB3090 TaxID=3039156 RepID=UPI0024B08B1A|nr:hypothetical protein [Rhizobium sp. CB3090]WFU13406.1 hypothetical protein QA646_29855 [Rhizobium sp. CB3090]
MMEEHTGNELNLMLEAKKPLAMFYFCRAMDDKDILPIDDFAPHVENGRIMMEEFDAPVPVGSDSKYQITYVLYALAAEAWRIPAMKIALTAQNENLRKPDEGIDRIIGMLLGYPKDAIDSWIQSGVDKGAYR